ncbi:N-acetylglucosaminyl-diphospho-decaprenol L-rhamnosyltransferase [Fundidesulfovibrio magnetotacticus]|uniref:N-acetylglucosaminyl-diphospho-decaprenol L-rhamnosyltransferase n=1 Tax=Fundidesulfovibrio magnetotacticus TaxID=2730080 RepID=A0A6V8LQ49_9BACT|nr:glycosyltransferase [Fundidesulfovibrio magnetotacticus]GFK92239.1 N-acetylglucosaminyl-diphospho-decaprenol L-rhamnosyltransferase [Fundidesulfovibrio magnetotacticus]
MDQPIVDVIIPVYKDYGATSECIHSVLSARNSMQANLVVIDDASEDDDIAALLSALHDQGMIRLISNTRNRGYIHAINQGIAANRSHDVVLLNSDTIVFDAWLDRLAKAAYSREDIGTVTPFSNNATICSYPKTNEDNPFMPRNVSQVIDRMFADANAGETCTLPTGVGFCMYIKRSCLNDTGLFDEHTFGRGYGEENDFCRRAEEGGWTNVLAADAFVPHRGAVSFAKDRKPALEKNLALLNARHPGYRQSIVTFILADPLLKFRRRIDEAVLRAATHRPLILRICHGRGGGTAKRLRDEAIELQNQNYRVATLLPKKDAPEGRTTLTIEDFPDLVNLEYSLPDDLEKLLCILRDINTVSAAVHHHIDLHPCVLDIPRRLDIPYSVIAHDYGWYCPGITLLDNQHRYCGDHCNEQCTSCTTSSEENITTEWSAEHKQNLMCFLENAQAIVAPCHDTALRYHKRTALNNIITRRHSANQLENPGTTRRFRSHERTRVALFGSIGMHKGYDTLLECAKDAQRRDLPLEFILIGESLDDYALFATGRVFVTGRYDEREVRRIIMLHAPPLALYPSIWPETWCYALDIAFECNIFPLAFAIGAPMERIRESGFGALLPLDSPPATINDTLLDIARDRFAHNAI